MRRVAAPGRGGRPLASGATSRHEEPPIEGLILLSTGGLLLAGVIVAVLSSRAGVPVLVGFLALGMLLGSEGPGGIHFDDPGLARAVGVAALAAILFEGGLTTAWRDVRSVLLPAGMLATVGVAVTAGVTGAAAYLLFDLSFTAALLLGAVVGSTDAAAVFLTLRASTLRRRLAGLLEVESGTNDPMAVVLTIGIISVLTEPDVGAGDLTLFLAEQLALGALVGVVLGAAAAWGVGRVPAAVAPFAPVASVGAAALSFGLADLVGGSGFLAIYLVGLRLGNTPSAFRGTLVNFHQGLAYMAQVALFVVLGLLVFPSELAPVILPGLALAAVLILLARPLAVVVSLVGQRFGAREQALLSWAGLRGAVPIVLATFPATEGVPASHTIFNAVFFVVLVSALVQGPTLEPLARRLGLTTERRALSRPPIEVGAVEGADLVEYVVGAGDAVVGRRVRELGLPRTALVGVIVRDRQALPPRGRTVVESGDRLYVLVRAEGRPEIERLLAAWESGPLPGTLDPGERALRTRPGVPAGDRASAAGHAIATARGDRVRVEAWVDGTVRIAAGPAGGPATGITIDAAHARALAEALIGAGGLAIVAERDLGGGAPAIVTTSLLGIGERLRVPARPTGALVVVVNRATSTRELYGGDGEPVLLAALSEEEGRQLAGLLLAASHRPALIEQLEGSMAEIESDWITVPPASRLAGRPVDRLALAGVGAAVLAVLEAQGEVRTPDADEPVRPGESLLVVGRRAALERARELIGAP